MAEEKYTGGEYLEKNPDWHVQDSPWKATQIAQLMQRNQLIPETICEVGCGAGEVLRQLQLKMDSKVRFWGYDISPQAIQLAQTRANAQLQFKQEDFLLESDTKFDLILIVDLIEHLEDYLAFLRKLKSRSPHKVFHIPLDLYALSILRSQSLIRTREQYGHINYFTKEIALAALKECGYEVIDYFYTPALDVSTKSFKAYLVKLPRKLMFSLNQDFAVRGLGGYSLMVLAK
jgi:hypothetical protein